MPALLNPLDGIGVELPRLKSAQSAMEQAGLAYEVSVEPIHNPHTNAPSDRFNAVYRKDSGQMLGTVERGYTTLQNHEFFVPLVDAITANTSARIVRAGEWDDGSYAFMTVGWPQSEDIIIRGDRVKRRFMVTINHTGKQSNLALFLPYRFWCSNGQIILVPGCEWMFRVFHKATAHDHMKEIGETLNRSMTYWQRLPMALDVLAQTTVSDAKALDLAQKFFDPRKKSDVQKDGKTPNEAKARVDRFMELWGDQPGVGKVEKELEKTAWWALQAGIHMMDHDRGTRAKKGERDNPRVVALQRAKAHWPGNQAARDKERWTQFVYNDSDLGIGKRIREACLHPSSN